MSTPAAIKMSLFHLCKVCEEAALKGGDVVTNIFCEFQILCIRDKIFLQSSHGTHVLILKPLQCDHLIHKKCTLVCFACSGDVEKDLVI